MTQKNVENKDIIDILGAIEVPVQLTNSLEATIIKDSIDIPVMEKVSVIKRIDPLSKEKDEKLETVTEKAVPQITPTSKIEKKVDTVNKKKNSFTRFLSAGLFAIKYIVTSVFIFSVLLLTTNYSAYSNIVKSYVFQDEIAQVSQSLINGVDASNIEKKEIPEIKIIKQTKNDRVNKIKQQEQKTSIKQNQFSITKLVNTLDKEDIDLNISIVPYENRIIIPKIGKNIPLIDIKETTVEGKTQLDNIFMKELEQGIVRYPGSALPGEKGNSFIFGHSSNFPWIAGDYNDVFSRLGQMEVGDIVYSYYGQKKYKYKIKEKKVISPNDVSILQRDINKKELTLMTCWPIGTTLNRLILIGEIVED